MKIQFLKEESLSFNGVDKTIFKIGDTLEVEKLNKVSSTLFDYYLKEGIAKIYDEREEARKKEEELKKIEEESELEALKKEYEDIKKACDELKKLNSTYKEVIDSLNEKIISMKKIEEKSENPVIENKAITNLDNKAEEPKKKVKKKKKRR
jgi:predicted RNase H-like nuclease (RuvC/YqgF family)